MGRERGRGLIQDWVQDSIHIRVRDLVRDVIRDAVLDRVRGWAARLCVAALVCGGLGAGWAQPGVMGGRRGQAGQAQQPALETNVEHVDGVVVSSVDGRPVARVLVTSQDRRFAALTDYEGRFSFDYRRVVMPAGMMIGDFTMGGMGGLGRDWVLAVFSLSRPGYVEDQTVARLPRDRPDGPEPPVRLKITPAAAIVGQVTPESGDAAGETVQVEKRFVQDGAPRWGMARSVAVNSRGEFRLGELAAGDYRVAVLPSVGRQAAQGQWPARQGVASRTKPELMPGLLPVFYPGVTEADAAGTLHLQAGETARVDLSPPAGTYYRVEIPVADSGARGMSVGLEPEGAGLTMSYVPQDRAVEGYLPAGKYAVHVTVMLPNAPGGAVRSEFGRVEFEVSRGPVRTAALTPVAGEDIPVVIRDERTQAAGEAGNGLGNGAGSGAGNGRGSRIAVAAFVNLLPLGQSGEVTHFINSQRGDGGDDAPKVTGVTEGVYRVEVNAVSGGYVSAASCGVRDLLREPLTVPASGAGCTIEVTLRDDAGTIHGSFAAGSAAAGSSAAGGAYADSALGIVFVMCLPLDRPMAQASETAVQPGGEFQMGNLAPGRYLVLASWSNLFFASVAYRDPEMLRGLMTRGVTVTVPAGGTVEAQPPILNGEW